MQARDFILHCMYGNDAEVIRAVRSGFDVNTAPYQGITGLHVACLNRHTCTVSILLDAEGININCKDDQGTTPLYNAILKECADIVEMLVKHPDFDINATSVGGFTALHVAVSFLPVAIPILVEHGINIDAKAEDGKSAIQIALRNADKHIGSHLSRFHERWKMSIQALVNFGCHLSEIDRQNPKVINALAANAAERKVCHQAFQEAHWLPSVQEQILNFLYL